MTNIQELIVGDICRFRDADLFREYGNWTIARIDHHKVYGTSAGTWQPGREQLMCYNNEPNYAGSAEVILVEKFNEEVVEEDWS